MRHTFRILLLLVLSFSLMYAKAQRRVRTENIILEKNIFIGVKGGVAALDMQYKKDKDTYLNHSALYQGIGNIPSCIMGSVFIERTIPYFSYGIELSLSHINAKTNPKDQSPYAKDSAFITSVRIPLRMKLLEENLFTPYIIFSPGISTYLNDTIAGISVNSYSKWNGAETKWGKENTKRLNINLIAGIGTDVKIPLMMYEIQARIEVCYNFGLLNLTPKSPDFDFERRMRGWEATIGLAFPLFTNPSYGWLN